MAVHTPCGGFLLLHRLVRTCTSSQRHLRYSEVLVKLTRSGNEIRAFSSGSVRCNENEREDSDPSSPGAKLTSRQAQLAGRRRPLSPLERISSLLPQDALSPEVKQLREQHQQEAQGEAEGDASAQAQEGSRPETLTGDETTNKEDAINNRHTADASVEPDAPARWRPLPGESLLAFGELVIAEFRKEHAEFKIMFTLQEGRRLHSSWGFIPHDSMAGQPPGQFLKTNLEAPIFIRRASLEDYVLHMKRGPAITYPKDASSMLMMMDVMEGDCVLESGSGSGAMSLFLSRAVGSKGSVLSLEVREDHLRRARSNYKSWRASWSVRRGEEWPDNVRFHNADLCKSSSLLAGRGFHAVALDMKNPYLALPSVIPHLHCGAVCAVYLANITKVIDLLEAIRYLALPLLCERIMEVPVRDWVVAPAMQKNGQYCTKKTPSLAAGPDEEEEEEEEEEEDRTDREAPAAGHPAFGSIPYIARPHPEQKSHTAFLVKLRKRFQ